jgi:hypothetical protein
MSIATRTHFTTGELGDFPGVQAWKIARRFETRALPEPARVGGRRLVAQSMIADVADGLRRRGWRPEQGAAR